MEVPVNPVWPKLRFEKYRPLEEGSVGTFQPSVRAFFAESARRSELRHCLASEDALVGIDAAVQHHLAEDCQVGGSGEHSRVAGDSAHGRSVFVMDLTVKCPLAGAGDSFRGGNARAERFWRTKQGVCHPERTQRCAPGPIRREAGRSGAR